MLLPDGDPAALCSLTVAMLVADLPIAMPEPRLQALQSLLSSMPPLQTLQLPVAGQSQHSEIPLDAAA